MNREPASSRKRAALYARVSSSKQQEEGTIESQLQRLVDYAEKHDLEIPDGWIFQDNGISGCAIQRPALDSLRDLVASGSPDLVVMYHPDRLARKYVYQVLLLDEFAKNGVQVAFCNSKKAETAEEHLLEQFQGVFAEYERAQITERCRRGRLHKARQESVTVIPNAPYGYRYVRDEKGSTARYELHQKESEVVLRLFQMYGVEGRKLSELCSYLNESGLRPRKSNLGWSRDSVRRILRNRAYTGRAGFGKTEKSEGDSQRIVRAPKSGRKQVSKSAKRTCLEESWITIRVPAIVSESLYRVVQDKLNGAQRYAARNTKAPSILQGILVCGSCGASYYKKARSNAHTYYCCHRTLVKSEKSCCNRSIRQKELDDYVWGWITALLRTPELVETEIKRRSLEDPDKLRLDERKMSLLREQNKLMTNRNKLLDAYAEGDCLSLEDLKKRMSILNQRTHQVDRELAVIDVQTANEDQIRHSQLTLEKFAKALDDSPKQLTVNERQRVVRALIDEIVINEDSIKIKHCIPVGNSTNQGSQKCPLDVLRSAGALPLIDSDFC